MLTQPIRTLTLSCAGSPLSWATVQASVQECGVFPVQLCSGVPGPGSLLSHHLSSLNHRSVTNQNTAILCFDQSEHTDSIFFVSVIAATGGACYIAGLKNAERKISVAGHEVSLAQQYAAIGLCSIPFFLFAGATGGRCYIK